MHVILLLLRDAYKFMTDKLTGAKANVKYKYT